MLEGGETFEKKNKIIKKQVTDEITHTTLQIFKKLSSKRFIIKLKKTIFFRELEKKKKDILMFLVFYRTTKLFSYSDDAKFLFGE